MSMTSSYIDSLRLTDQRKAAVRALVNRLAPERRYWFQFWRWTDDARYRLAFDLVNFMVQCVR